jgi:hypothetical protein
MTEPDRLAAALRYQQELEEAQRPATMNPNMAAQGRRMNLPARQEPGALSEFVTKGVSLDPQPDQGYGTMAADMALSFIPGVGQAMAARDLERARRDNDPLGMALAGTSFVPFGKLIGALRGGKQIGPVSQLDVYHGSPYKFDQFDASKIGTGEGAQAYGHGLYFAENPDVALGYQRKLADAQKPNIVDAGLQSLYAKTGDWEKAVDDHMRRIYDTPKAKEKMRDSLIKQGPPTNTEGGSLYKVDLPDAQIAKFLDWDKPLSQQSKEVQKAFFSTRKNLTPMDIENLGGRAAVNQLYGMDNTVGDFLGTWQSLRGSKDAGEKMLQQAGIPGIRYLDQGSRAGGAGTSNFVVFPGSEGLLNILGRE